MGRIASCLALSAILPFSGTLVAQDVLPPRKAPSWAPQITVSGQLWATYTHGGKTWDANRSAYVRDEGQANALLRRARVGVRGDLYPNLSYTAILAFDQVGHDPRSGTGGGSNNESFPKAGLLDAFVLWKLPGWGEALALTAGYLRPQYGREHITAGFAVNSMEKMATQNYLRSHLIGTVPGRAPGGHLGGLVGLGRPTMHLQYDAGFFLPPVGKSGGFPWLLTARTVWQLGQPESREYGISHKINYFGRREGLSLALNAAWRGASAGLGASRGWGADLLVNHGPFQLDAEIHRLDRLGDGPGVEAYRMYTGHIRLGCNVWRTSRGTLEPVASWVFFQGGMDAPSQQRAAEEGLSAGRESALEAGLNWWLDPQTVIQLFHTWRAGALGAAGAGATVNPYFFQAEVGPIRRGHWLGVGIRFQR